MACKDVAEVLSVAELCRRCQDENARYRRGLPAGDRYCLEVIRRAVVERDETCWRELHQIYHPQVVAWCRRGGAGGSPEAEELASIAWQKFWRNFTAEKLGAAAGSSAVLRYLKMCARSAAIDALRAASAPLHLDELSGAPVDQTDAPAEAQVNAESRARFWQIVNAVLRNERERVLLSLMYDVGLKASEIQARRPDLFPEIGQVYRLTRNILDRLSRSVELRRWREEEHV